MKGQILANKTKNRKLGFLVNQIMITSIDNLPQIEKDSYNDDDRRHQMWVFSGEREREIYRKKEWRGNLVLVDDVNAWSSFSFCKWKQNKNKRQYNIAIVFNYIGGVKKRNSRLMRQLRHFLRKCKYFKEI